MFLHYHVFVDLLTCGGSLFNKFDLTWFLLLHAHLQCGNIGEVEEFIYLGSLIIWDNDYKAEIKRRIAKTTEAMAGFTRSGTVESSALKLRCKSLCYAF